ncbi:SMP-30/gluconolactonase/LRE family protein [Salinibacillus xinjiangensis]|uniref:SMP-30/gluconolactonase/LRE family protein n=1 Tax=Salinibacillus xinjiangensis TaxID=1229268 RepID=A0A6G1X1U1_9BACI|nr:SMP-30/gluconolactonase/LRE family protein [Salinibacillus xinjiangensis]MRG84855.1 SMP-30/gluconolactonase/LRE family protein [Salinibacillus xinjiangensis]
MRNKVLPFAIIIIISLVTISVAVADSVYEKAGKPPSNERHTLSEILPSSSQWEKVVTADGFIEGLNFDRDGQMWMTAIFSGEIMKVNGNEVEVVETYGNPNGAKFHKDGRLFIADLNGELYTLDPPTGKRTTILEKYKTEHLRGLNDLVFDDKGGIYFTEPHGSSATKPNGRVFYLPPGKDTKLQLFQDNIAYPNGVAISPDGQHVYIAEYDKNQIIAAPSVHTDDIYDTPYVFARFEGGIGPDGLAVDNEGNLYVAHYKAGEVIVLDSKGFKYGKIRLPKEAGTYSTNLAFHNGYLYVTESEKNEVWRIKIKKKGLKTYGLQ